ncbi:hypothetical protein BOTCAL_0352g00020 [Botryotinia calthae]|uniref:Uncharacterized protein n=1 Tax=Botryotinia calthae TaxID=38488 RepID=A0A4Y8CTB4_9HELO|nr:hypothetical protein BOTCAL_0352g00020 [Botryotinia calthae]
MLEDSEFLRQYIQASVDVDRFIVMGQSPVVNGDISTRIRQWIVSPTSGILWIEGPHGVEHPGQNTLVSAFILSNLRLAHLPVMTEFCHYDARDWRTWNPATDFSSLIGQIINVMGGVIETDETCPNLSTERFQRLKENADALPAAIQLLAHLISVGPALQFCIIDGLEIFDGCEGSALLKKNSKGLIALICKSVAAKSFSTRERIFKALFTANGFVRGSQIVIMRNLLCDWHMTTRRKTSFLHILDHRIKNLAGAVLGWYGSFEFHHNLPVFPALWNHIIFDRSSPTVWLYSPFY